MMAHDLAAINIPHNRRRGNLDAEIDRNLAAQRRAARAETVESINGVPHLTRGGMIRTWANRTQAERAANRVGGTAYQDQRSKVFHVRLPDEQEDTPC